MRTRIQGWVDNNGSNNRILVSGIVLYFKKHTGRLLVRNVLLVYRFQKKSIIECFRMLTLRVASRQGRRTFVLPLFVLRITSIVPDHTMTEWFHFLL